MTSESEQLLKQVRECTICEEKLNHKPRPVIQFHPNARILIAGQAPGRRVHESGIPFDDPSGDRLRSWLNISKVQFYNPQLMAILPMGFCFPGTGRSGDLPPRHECAPAWRRHLLNELSRIELTLLIGQYAHEWHLPNAKGSLTDRVKEALWKESNVIPLPHPSPRNNLWLLRNPWFEEKMIPKIQLKVSEIISSNPSAQD